MKSKKFLYFQVYAPIAAFGEVAVGEYRPSYDHPSKSFVLGLLAACLGIRRSEEARLMELEKNLQMAVCVLSHGRLLRDYHTTQVPKAASLKKHPAHTRKDELQRAVKDVSTILSTRDYRSDGVYGIALYSKGKDGLLEKCQAALKSPGFSPYIGRKACPPALPFDPLILEAKTPADALSQGIQKMAEKLGRNSKRHPLNKWAEKLSLPLPIDGPAPNIPIFYEADNSKEAQLQNSYHRRDRLLHRGNWQYAERLEVRDRLTVTPPKRPSTNPKQKNKGEK